MADQLPVPATPPPSPLGGSPGGWWPAQLEPPSRRRATIAFAVAGVSDILSIGLVFAPPAQIAVDLATAVILWWLLGARWPLLPALIAEAIPVLQLFPSWTMVAGAYWWYSRRRD